jgi:hypothetical protein
MKNKKQLEPDARRIDDRHSSGELSDSMRKALKEIVENGRGGDWAGTEKRPDEFREQNPFFK